MSYKEFIKNLETWAQSHLHGLFIFNLLIISLLLLRSGGYFNPYFTITINTVVFCGFVGAIILLGVRSKTLFVLSLIFWIFSAFMKSLGVDIWAERISIYAYQAMLCGVVLLFFK